MTKLLSQHEIETKLSKLPVEWTVLGGTKLYRLVDTKSFTKGAGITAKIAELAEESNHHPEVTLSWSKLEISLTTHSENGLTLKDFQLAKKIEELL